MKKSDNYQTIILYYNIHTDITKIKAIQKKYQQCQKIQPSLISNLQLLQQKRKLLCQNLKDIRDQYLSGLQQNMSNIFDLAKSLAKKQKDDGEYHANGISSDQNVAQDLKNYNEQALELKKSFIQKNDNEHITEVENISSRAQKTRNPTDLKRLAQQCIQLKTKICELSSQYLQIQKLLLNYITNIIQMIQKLDKKIEIVESQKSKQNIIDFEYKCKKYFGDNIYEIIKFIQYIGQIPIRIYQNLHKFLMEKQKIFKKIVDQKQYQLKNYQKYLGFKQLSQNRCQFKSTVTSISPHQFQTFKQSTITFLTTDTLLTKKYFEHIYHIIQYINQQFDQNLTNNILKKYKDNYIYKLFLDYYVQLDIVSIVQNDQKYNLLFNDQILQQIHPQHFKSLLINQKCQSTKIILRKKTHKSKNITMIQRKGCCSKTKITKNISKIKSTLLLNNNIKIFGNLLLSDTYVNFVQKKANPFIQKIQLLIPINQIKGYYSIKIQQTRILQLITNIGLLKIIPEQLSLLQQYLQKHQLQKLQKKEQNEQKYDSYQKSGEISTSIFRQSISSLQLYKINSFQQKLDKSIKINHIPTIKQLCQLSQYYKCFSDKFIKIKSHLHSNNQIIQYHYYDGISKFVVKQFKLCKLNQLDHNFVIDILWKVTFPQFPMLKSFTHSQTLTINLNANQTKIIVSQKRRTQQHLHMKSIFYSQIQAMNKKLSDYIVKQSQKQGQLIIDQQIKYQLVSNSDLDFDQIDQFKNQ